MDAARSKVFDGLSAEERSVWLSAARHRDLGRGEALARQGEPADAFSLVESGLLKLVQATPDGRDVIVRFVGPREPFGGVVALDDAAYPVTALASGPTRVLVWPRDTLRRLLAAYPQVRTNIMREMAGHMTEAMTRVRELSTEPAAQRVARAVLRLMRQCGQTMPDGILLDYPFTRQELAELSGTTLYTASRTMAAWQAGGIVQSSGRRVLVRSPRQLEALARGQGH